jgi:hypothetical protein
LGADVPGVAPAYAWLAAICADAKPTITKVKAAIATNAITIFVLLICLSPYNDMCMEAYRSWLKHN